MARTGLAAWLGCSLRRMTRLLATPRGSAAVPRRGQRGEACNRASRRSLRATAHRSKREIDMLVAELAPRPDVPSRMRRLPDTKATRLTVGAAEPRPDLTIDRNYPSPVALIARRKPRSSSRSRT
jgi:hypothetical protein